MIDYSTPPCPKGCAADHTHVRKGDAVEMVVRPGGRFNSSRELDRVRVNKSELLVPSVAHVLWTDDQLREHRAAEAQARAEAESAAHKPNPIGDAIRAQLEAAWKGGRKKPAHRPAIE